MHWHGRRSMWRCTNKVGAQRTACKSSATWQSDTGETIVSIGNNRWRSQVKGGGVEVDIDLDLQVARVGSIAGTIHLHGQLPTRSVVAHTSATPSPHQWNWQAARATTTAALNVSGASWQCTGPGYHDQNCGAVPLSSLGIARWLWGRLSSDDSDAVVYALWRDGDDLRGPATECTLVRVADGALTQQPATIQHRLANTWLGMAKTVGVDAASDDIRMHGTAVSCIDSGPFYTRSWWRGDIDGRSAVGMVEVVDPPRIDIGWQRPFVRMRVAGPSPSLFLPLFSGPNRGRWSRWLGL
jgi:hypothetical protein